MRNIIIRSAVFMLLAAFIGVLLLCIAYSIPDNAIKESVNGLQEAIDTECPGRVDTRFFSYAYGSKNMPDTFILDLSFRGDTPLIKAALGGIGSDEGNKRYWDGFMVIVRPLMVFLSYGQIRYFLVLIECLLLWYVVVKTNERIGKGASFALSLSLILINLIVNFFGVMLNMDFIVMFAFSAWICRYYDEGMSLEKLFYIFLADGILTTYLDRYTASLLTLELPLLIVLMINIRKRGKESFTENVRITAVSVTGWGIGWSVFWMIKWIIAGPVLGVNVLGSAFRQASMRATVNADSSPVHIDGYKGNRFFTILKNIGSLIPTHGENIPAVTAIIIMVLVVMALYLKMTGSRLKYPKIYLPIIFLMAMPYAYYFILSNLCQIHATFYMYRMQLSTLTGAIYLYSEAFKPDLPALPPSG